MTHQFPLPPSSNRYWRMFRGRMLVSAVAKDYKTTVGMLARCARVEQLTGPVAVTLNIYRERKAGDLDNYAKVLCDSLQGVFYANDAQIVELHMFRHDDRHNPRCEVEVVAAHNIVPVV